MEPSQIGVFLLWKIEYLVCCITAARAYCKKDNHHGRWACMIDIKRAVSLWRYIF